MKNPLLKFIAYVFILLTFSLGVAYKKANAQQVNKESLTELFRAEVQSIRQDAENLAVLSEDFIVGISDSKIIIRDGSNIIKEFKIDSSKITNKGSVLINSNSKDSVVIRKRDGYLDILFDNNNKEYLLKAFKLHL